MKAMSTGRTPLLPFSDPSPSTKKRGHPKKYDATHVTHHSIVLVALTILPLSPTLERLSHLPRSGARTSPISPQLVGIQPGEEATGVPQSGVNPRPSGSIATGAPHRSGSVASHVYCDRSGLDGLRGSPGKRCIGGGMPSCL